MESEVKGTQRTNSGQTEHHGRGGKTTSVWEYFHEEIPESDLTVGVNTLAAQ